MVIVNGALETGSVSRAANGTCILDGAGSAKSARMPNVLANLLQIFRCRLKVIGN